MNEQINYPSFPKGVRAGRATDAQFNEMKERALAINYGLGEPEAEWLVRGMLNRQWKQSTARRPRRMGFAR